MLTAALLCACAADPGKLEVQGSLPAFRVAPTGEAVRVGQGAGQERQSLKQAAGPQLPHSGPAVAGLGLANAKPELAGEPIAANVENLALPAFINEVFGNLLKLSFQLDPALANKSDLVTLRVSQPQAPANLYALATRVLQSYGVASSWEGDLVRFSPAATAGGTEPPLVISGRALPDVPISHRPVFQLVELESVRAIDVAGWLRTAFGSSGVQVAEDINRNGLVLTGKPADVAQVVEAIRVLDRPFMRGRFSLRLEPAFISADEMAKRLAEVLSAEGYGASTSVQPGTSTIVLPVAATNMVLVFAGDRTLLSHVSEWASSLDKPAATGGKAALYYYQVQNTKADDLARTLTGLSGGVADAAKNASNKPSAPGAVGSAGGGAASVLGAGGRLLVDAPRNALIFQGDPSEWERLQPLIRQMDKSIRQVLIEVTIAEVTLDDSEEFGVSWLAKGSHGRFDDSLTSGKLPVNPWVPTTGGSGGSNSSAAFSGLSYILDVAGSSRAQLKAFAQDKRVSILSTPRLMVKSGDEASIDVGTEVPTITAQTTSAQQTSGNSNLLQSIQYRKTGIILNVKPTVYSDDRIDLEVNQEVSDALPLADDATAGTPSIFNRSVKTSLSLRDGGSILLGGLMSSRITNSDGGVPLLKDIPLLGHLFKSSGKSNNKTELVIMIVPYVIQSDGHGEALTRALGERLQTISLPEPVKPKPLGEAQ
ncbi:MAG: type II secretion system protein GspD [Gammaproteobacteria bacterium]|nr:type II secretion system protein GspD [Gammaproteobacteria bacterium]